MKQVSELYCSHTRDTKSNENEHTALYAVMEMTIKAQVEWGAQSFTH